MRRVSLIVLLNLCITLAYAQQGSVGIQTNAGAGNTDDLKTTDTTVHRLGPIIFLNGGVGSPLGKFSTSYFDYISSTGIQGKAGFNGLGGFARTGFVISALTEIPVKQSNWGIVALAGFNMNSFNVGDYAYPYSYNPHAYYRSFAVMPGVYAELEGDKVNLDLRALVGVLISQSPEIQYSGDSIYSDLVNLKQDTETIYKDIKPTVATAFAFDIGVSLRLRLNTKLVLTVNADYEQAYPTYLTTMIYRKGADNVGGFTSIYCPVALLNISAGIGYRFGK